MEKVKEFLSDLRLRWFGHVKIMNNERARVKANIFEGGSKICADRERNEKKLWKKPFLQKD